MSGSGWWVSGAAWLLASCAGGGALTGGGVRTADLSSVPVRAEVPKVAPREALALAIEAPEVVDVEIAEYLPDQVSFLRKPAVLGRARVEGVRAGLEALVRRGLTPMVTELRSASGAGDRAARLRFSGLRIALGPKRPPVTTMYVSSCVQGDGTSASADVLGETTQTFGVVPVDQQALFLSLDAQLELSASGRGSSINLTVRLAGRSDGFPPDSGDLDGMLAQAIDRAAAAFYDELPLALARLADPDAEVAALFEKVCTERGIEKATGL